MLFIETFPLLAAPDWLQVGVGFIVFVLYAIGQIMSIRQEAKKKKARSPQPKPLVPQAPQAGVPAVPPNQADPLRAEVEEFLRRAQGKPAQQKSAEPKTASLSRPRPPRETAKRRQKPQPSQTVDLRLETAAGHVARHVSTQDFAEHTSHLGKEVSLANEHMEAHLEEAFSGQLGGLQHRERKVADEDLTIAEEIRNLLSHPAGIRQMIVANEILRRPEDRW